MKGKVSLYYNQITFGLQSGYNLLHHRLHRGSTQYKQFPQKKKKGGDKGERQNERKEKERKEKERK